MIRGISRQDFAMGVSRFGNDFKCKGSGGTTPAADRC